MWNGGVVSKMGDNGFYQGPAGSAGDAPARQDSGVLAANDCPLCNSRGYKTELHSNHIYFCACSFGKKLQNGLAELVRNSAK
jgi:hypothetical protein